MFSSSKNVETICQLFRDAKEYGQLRLEQLELDASSKLSRLVGILVVGAVLLVMLLVALVFLSIAAGYALAALLQSVPLAMLIVGLVYLALALALYFNRRAWVFVPITLLLHDILLPEATQQEGNDEQ